LTNVEASLPKYILDFAPIFPNQNFWGCVCTLAPPTPAPLLLPSTSKVVCF